MSRDAFDLKNLFFCCTQIDVVSRFVLKGARLIEMHQQQFDTIASYDPVLQKSICFETSISTMESLAYLSANISHLNPDGGFGIHEVHMIPQQVAEICDPRFLSVFAMIRMIAEFPFSWNKEGLTCIRPIKVCYAMVLQPEIDWARLFDK